LVDLRRGVNFFDSRVIASTKDWIVGLRIRVVLSLPEEDKHISPI